MDNHKTTMLKSITLSLLGLFASHSWAQIHPKTHQHLNEVLEYENNLADSYPVFLAIPEGLDEAQPLHFYQDSENEVARLSTYYFSKRDSLVTKTLHQWSSFDAQFKPNKLWTAETILNLRNKYTYLQEELALIYGKDVLLFEKDNQNSTIRSEAIKWKIPLLYDPLLEYRELENIEDFYGVITLAYVHQGWEETIIKQLDFLQYYFISKIKDGDYKAAISMLSPDLQDEVQEMHIEEFRSVLEKYELELFDSKEGFADLEREYVFMYRLIDAEGEPKYTMNIAFNNNQDILFLQYNPL